MRKITIYSTRGNSGSFETAATTWGEIKEQVINIVGSLENLIATENINKTNLENTGAVLPESAFTLFLRPAKTKSGISFSKMSFKELRDYIKEEGQSVKDFLNAYAKKNGRNWTQLTTQEMQTELSKYPKQSPCSEQGTIRGTLKPVEIEEEDTWIENLRKEFEELEKGFAQ